MPLLPSEPFVFPDDLFSSDVESGESASGSWWVLHTKPRVEKALARRFLARKLPYFLPIYKRQWRNRGRQFAAHLPLFPGYVFLQGDADARLCALESNQVVRILPVPDPVRLRDDLARVYRMMQAGLLMAPEEQLQPGTPVEIVSGALTGMTGQILRRGTQMRFFVEVQMLRCGVSVEIEGWMIRVLHMRSPLTAANKTILV